MIGAIAFIVWFAAGMIFIAGYALGAVMARRGTEAPPSRIPRDRPDPRTSGGSARQ